MYFSILLTFLCGVLIEALSVLWVHFAERNSYIKIFIASISISIAYVYGLKEAFTTQQGTIAFILGFGVGGVFGLYIKRFIKH